MATHRFNERRSEDVWTQAEGLHKEASNLGEETARRELQQSRHVVNVFPTGRKKRRFKGLCHSVRGHSQGLPAQPVLIIDGSLPYTIVVVLSSQTL